MLEASYSNTGPRLAHSSSLVHMLILCAHAGGERTASGDHEADLAAAGRSLSMGSESPVGALRTRSGSEGASTALHRWNQSCRGAQSDPEPRSAAHQMNESTLLEALGPRVGFLLMLPVHADDDSDEGAADHGQTCSGRDQAVA